MAGIRMAEDGSQQSDAHESRQGSPDFQLRGNIQAFDGLKSERSALNKPGENQIGKADQHDHKQRDRWWKYQSGNRDDKCRCGQPRGERHEQQVAPVNRKELFVLGDVLDEKIASAKADERTQDLHESRSRDKSSVLLYPQAARDDHKIRCLYEQTKSLTQQHPGRVVRQLVGAVFRDPVLHGVGDLWADTPFMANEVSSLDSPGPLQNGGDGSHKDKEDEAERPGVDVVEIPNPPVIEIGVAAAIDLPQTRQTRLHAEASHERWRDEFGNISLRKRPWPYQRHFAPQHVEELW